VTQDKDTRSSLKKLLAERKLWRGEECMISPQRRGEGEFCFGIKEIDRLLTTGFSKGSTHQWSLQDSLTSKAQGIWYAPLLVFTHIVSNALFSQLGSQALIAWIGRRCWLHPRHCEGKAASLIERSLFVAATSAEDRLWSALQCLRERSIALVIVDGSEFSFTTLRRVKLTARRNKNLCFIVKPPWEQQRTAAETRWLIQPAASNSVLPRWQLTLERAPGLIQKHSWLLEHEESTYRLHISREPRRSTRTEKTRSVARP